MKRPAPSPAGEIAATGSRSRSYWLKTLHRWHWISSAICLVGMLAFAITGITLNHAADIEATPAKRTATVDVPADVLAELRAIASRDDTAVTLPRALRRWSIAELGIDPASGVPEWSVDELYVAVPRAGGDAWLAVDLAAGTVEYEDTDRGWIAYFNDLHKGRNTGPLWDWFIDVFAVACIVFCVTGFFLLQMHARQRGLTWPMVALGVLVPLLLLLLFH